MPTRVFCLAPSWEKGVEKPPERCLGAPEALELGSDVSHPLNIL